MALSTEVNFRRTNFADDWEQFILRPFVQYKFRPNFTGAIGYSNIKNYSFASYATPMDNTENNVWEQALIKQQLKGLNVSHRIRLEERFRENIIKNNGNPYTDGTTYTTRLRYRFILDKPIIKNHNISAILYDELFLNFEQDLRPHIIDQNWIFAGFRFKDNAHFNITSGYHYIQVFKQNSSILNHIFETSLVYIL
ncbi:MAG: DUF2490 domain-containing protein [Gelidibacter sp.]